MELEEIFKMEKITWTQKSRCLWLKQGDNNTAFSTRWHSHKRFNHIDKLEIGEYFMKTKRSSKMRFLVFMRHYTKRMKTGEHFGNVSMLHAFTARKRSGFTDLAGKRRYIGSSKVAKVKIAGSRLVLNVFLQKVLADSKS